MKRFEKNFRGYSNDYVVVYLVSREDNEGYFSIVDRKTGETIYDYFEIKESTLFDEEYIELLFDYNRLTNEIYAN